MVGVLGRDVTSRSIMTAMPGVGTRACSESTKEFQAASSGRGSAVTTTVSSTSQITPVRWFSSMTSTSVLAPSPWATLTSTGATRGPGRR